MRRVVRIGAGFGLIAIGIVGLILPVMPGWVFIIPGLVILSEHFDWARRLVHWAKEKAHEAKERVGGSRKESGSEASGARGDGYNNGE